MTGRRAVVGLCMLCALAFSAFAAQGASAAKTKGTTAFTCKNVGGTSGSFTKAHCKPGDVGAGPYEHVGIAANTKTEITGTNAKTNAATTEPTITKLKAIIGGVETELQSNEVHGTGWMTNALDERKNEAGEIELEHYAHGTGTITYKGVVVTKPANRCKVFTDEEGKNGAEGVVDTEPLIATTTKEGDFVKFEGENKDPVTGEPLFATFNVTCNPVLPALEGTYKVTGSITCPTDGATINCNHAEITTQGKLKTKGAKAGLEGSLTLSGRLEGGSEETTPLSATTVETPNL